MKQFHKLQVLFLFASLSFTTTSSAQFVFNNFVDSIFVGFQPDGIEFIGDDLWMVEVDKLVQYSFPELIEKNRYHIPIGLKIASDITSDGSDFIWLGEGRGSPFGYLHTFDIEEGRFIDKVKLNTEGFYQIQGLDYHEGKLWISNWNQFDFSVLITDLQGNIEEELDLERQILLPIALDGDILITGNSDFLFAFEKNIVGLMDFLVFQTIEPLTGVADIYDGKFWFSRRNGQRKIYSIEIKDLFVSTNDLTDSFELTMSPNPANDHISLQTDLDINGFSGMVIDYRGKIVLSDIIDFTNIDISALAPQNYILVLYSSDKMTTGSVDFVKF